MDFIYYFLRDDLNVSYNMCWFCFKAVICKKR